ncbi:MAG: ATPase, T2SS/T4P/T4SS family [Candidatus Omnitrophota bacterium]|nr:ATPase, T2SS/T4P/T4SS family [Candidatus Omnitrophota bacterium]
MKLGEILVNKGYITKAQLDQGLIDSGSTGEILGKTLMKLGFITEEKLLMALSEQLGLVYYPSLKDVVVDAAVIKAVPARFVEHYKFMPLKLKGKTLTIAISNPLESWSLEDIRLHLGFDTEKVLASEEEIQVAIRKYYGIGADTVERILETGSDKQKPVAGQDVTVVEDIEKSAEDASVIKLVNLILVEAISSRATDIHIEPYRDRVRVRQRIDGILYTMKVPEDIKFLHPAIVSRIKILSHLDVVERRIPQDGRARIKLADSEVDLRISIIPGFFGENVVIRVLPIKVSFNFDEVGLSDEERKIVEGLIKRPHGVMFLTGPTGSGKTTTLYSFLAHINSAEVKIITIEDPVEYELEGVTQIQINPKIGFSFASALRSILRHDPDVMMIGEVRDLETAELAIRSALTGHLIFSTLHTNDAPSAATRLVDIGIEPYLLASSVNAFIAQRLVRQICPNCKEMAKEPLTEIRRIQLGIPSEVLEDRRKAGGKEIMVYRGRGCEVCRFTGFKGRLAIFEILVIEDSIRELIIKKAPASEIKKKACELGMKTLRQQGWQKVVEGLTTPEEVVRVVQLEE